jgi:polysaccharide pyruvyl transferase WcaK-like protein
VFRIPVMVYAQGIGPLRSAAARQALRLLRTAAAVTVRDAESAEILQRAGVPGVEVTADAVLSLPRPEGRFPEELRDLGVHPGDAVVALAPRPYGGDGFAAGLARAADLLAAQLPARIVLVPMQRAEDIPACERIAAAMRAPAAVLRQRLPHTRYPAVFAAFRAVLGMRLHALVLAAVCRLPAVGLTYDPKIEAFLDSLGSRDALLGLDSAPTDIAGRVRGVLAGGDGRAERLDAAVSRLQALARRNDERLRALLPPR